MKLKHIFLFCISLLCSPSILLAQEQTSLVSDSMSTATKYGLRLGFDLAKPLRTLVEDDYSGFEVMGDFRVYKKFYVAAEVGNESKERIEANLNSTTSGSFLKLGADYNAYNNWFGLNNAIYFGLRYGFSTFKQELISYEIYATDHTFPPTTIYNSQEFSGLSAHWAELIFGVKTEVLANLYLTLNFQLKRKLAEDKPENFDNLFIPGFNRTYDFSEFGAGFGYGVSYLIPIFKK